MLSEMGMFVRGLRFRIPLHPIFHGKLNFPLVLEGFSEVRRRHAFQEIQNCIHSSDSNVTECDFLDSVEPKKVKLTLFHVETI